MQAVDAERKSAKAFKLVQEKEEEIEYYVRQLESFREKNNMLRTQLDMEQQCKEVEVSNSISSPPVMKVLEIRAEKNLRPCEGFHFELS